MKNYFPHDYNSRNDRKLTNVMMKMGLHGIGLYWCIVEMLYEENGYLKLSECERIAFEMRTQYDDVMRLISEFELFAMDEEKFWSNSILKRLEIRAEKSKKAAESAQARWNKANDANALRTHNERNAIKEKKRKEKKRKCLYIGEKVVYDVYEHLQSEYPIAYQSWQQNFPLANIQECSVEFMNLHMFETLNDEKHFKNAFTKYMRDKQRDNEIKKRFDKDETEYEKIISY